METTNKNVKIPSNCKDCPYAKNYITNEYGSFCECWALKNCEVTNFIENGVKHSYCPYNNENA